MPLDYELIYPGSYAPRGYTLAAACPSAVGGQQRAWLHLRKEVSCRALFHATLQANASGMLPPKPPATIPSLYRREFLLDAIALEPWYISQVYNGAPTYFQSRLRMHNLQGPADAQDVECGVTYSIDSYW